MSQNKKYIIHAEDKFIKPEKNKSLKIKLRQNIQNSFPREIYIH